MKLIHLLDVSTFEKGELNPVILTLMVFQRYQVFIDIGAQDCLICPSWHTD